MRNFRFAGGAWALGKKTYLMGILNVTPDSFSDGGRFFSPAAALAQAIQLERDGADMIDIGACSTRPFAVRAEAQEELRRLKAVLPAIRRAVKTPISVDTYRPAVAAYALEQGADVINDVSGVFSAEMAALAVRCGAGLIVMHAGGETAEAQVDYPDGVEAAVAAFFERITAQYLDAGLQAEQLCLDPGFGFGKTEADNIRLLRGLSGVWCPPFARLAGLSRKRFVAALSKEADAERLYGTLCADLAALQGGADLLRVHDVGAHVPACRAADTLWREREEG